MSWGHRSTLTKALLLALAATPGRAEPVAPADPVAASAAPISTPAVTTPAATSAVPSTSRILVLDFGGLPEASGRAAAVVAAAVVDDNPRFEVLTSADLRAMMEREANLQKAGCDGDESCLAELASALGARQVLSGSVAQLGGRYLLSVALIDADAGVALGREVRELDSLDDLSTATRTLTADVMAPFLPSTPWPAVVGGTALAVGGLAAAVGIGGAITASLVEISPTTSGDEKDLALQWHLPASVVGVVGAAVAVGGLGLWLLGPDGEAP